MPPSGHSLRGGRGPVLRYRAWVTTAMGAGSWAAGTTMHHRCDPGQRTTTITTATHPFICPSTHLSLPSLLQGPQDSLSSLSFLVFPPWNFQDLPALPSISETLSVPAGLPDTSAGLLPETPGDPLSPEIPLPEGHSHSEHRAFQFFHDLCYPGCFSFVRPGYSFVLPGVFSSSGVLFIFLSFFVVIFPSRVISGVSCSSSEEASGSFLRSPHGNTFLLMALGLGTILCFHDLGRVREWRLFLVSRNFLNSICFRLF